MIRMNRMHVALLGAAIAAAGIGYAVQAAEDHTTTFTFNYKNCKLTVPTGPVAGALTATGSTNVPNVGTVTLNGRLFVGEGGVTGTATLTVKKTGDKLFVTFSNSEIDSTGEFEGTVTITGGTGLYENAEGTGLVEGTVKFVRGGAASARQTTVATFSFLAQGVISF